MKERKKKQMTGETLKTDEDRAAGPVQCQTLPVTELRSTYHDHD